MKVEETFPKYLSKKPSLLTDPESQKSYIMTENVKQLTLRYMILGEELFQDLTIQVVKS